MNYVRTHAEVKKIIRLAKKHHRQCENSCNGRGWLNGKLYTLGQVESPNEQSGIIGDHEDETVFDLACDKYEAEIQGIADEIGFKVNFQRDPRGHTVNIRDEAGVYVNY